jgi:hypothetical protein
MASLATGKIKYPRPEIVSASLSVSLGWAKKMGEKKRRKNQKDQVAMRLKGWAMDGGTWVASERASQGGVSEEGG